MMLCPRIPPGSKERSLWPYPKAYRREGIDLSALPPEEQLQASIIICSAARKEVWNFGDCKLRINTENYDHTKAVDILFGSLRAFCMEAIRISGDDSRVPEGEDYLIPCPNARHICTTRFKKTGSASIC